MWEGVIESKACKPNIFTNVRFWIQVGYGQRCVIVEKGKIQKVRFKRTSTAKRLFCHAMATKTCKTLCFPISSPWLLKRIRISTPTCICQQKTPTHKVNFLSSNQTFWAQNKQLWRSSSSPIPTKLPFDVRRFCTTLLHDGSGKESHLQRTGNGSSSRSSEASPWVETQVKTTPMSSLVAVYWRVEKVVDKPVGGSILVLLEMTTAAGGRRKSVEG